MGLSTIVMGLSNINCVWCIIFGELSNTIFVIFSFFWDLISSSIGVYSMEISGIGLGLITNFFLLLILLFFSCLVIEP